MEAGHAPVEPQAAPPEPVGAPGPEGPRTGSRQGYTPRHGLPHPQPIRERRERPGAHPRAVYLLQAVAPQDERLELPQAPDPSAQAGEAPASPLRQWEEPQGPGRPQICSRCRSRGPWVGSRAWSTTTPAAPQGGQRRLRDAPSAACLMTNCTEQVGASSCGLSPARPSPPTAVRSPGPPAPRAAPAASAQAAGRAGVRDSLAAGDRRGGSSGSAWRGRGLRGRPSPLSTCGCQGRLCPSGGARVPTHASLWRAREGLKAGFEATSVAGTPHKGRSDRSPPHTPRVAEG